MKLSLGNEKRNCFGSEQAELRLAKKTELNAGKKGRVRDAMDIVPEMDTG